MIRTRFGCQVSKVIRYDEETGFIVVLVETKEREYHISELKADDGAKEIFEAIGKLSAKP